MSPRRLSLRDDEAALTGADSKMAPWEEDMSRGGGSMRGSTFLGFSRKNVALVLLVLQNSALIMTMHYSRVVPVAAGRRYLPSTAVLLVEVIKLVFCFAVALYQVVDPRTSTAPANILAKLQASICSDDSWKLIFPAALYTLQNSLVYVAIGNLSAVSFQVTYQLKILTTVLFSILLLRKPISPKQWLALVLLTAGVATVQTSGSWSMKMVSVTDIKSRLLLWLSQADALGKSADGTFLLNTSETLVGKLKNVGTTNQMASPAISGPPMNATKGVLAVLAASATSGLTCVYFEKVVKDSLASVSLWSRNVQLSFFSLFPALIIGVLLQDGAEISRSGFFVGYNWLVWTTIALQAFGGILVALCITYADNIAKNFAASISIVTSCIASTVFFDTPLTANFMFGTGIVLLAVYLYHARDAAAPQLLLPTNRSAGKSDNIR